MCLHLSSNSVLSLLEVIRGIYKDFDGVACNLRIDMTDFCKLNIDILVHILAAQVLISELEFFKSLTISYSLGIISLAHLQMAPNNN